MIVGLKKNRISSKQRYLKVILDFFSKPIQIVKSFAFLGYYTCNTASLINKIPLFSLFNKAVKL